MNYDSMRLMFVKFPITIGVVLGIVVAVLIWKKVFAGEGASSGSNKAIIILFLAICACIGLCAWGFKNVHPPDLSGNTWK